MKRQKGMNAMNQILDFDEALNVVQRHASGLQKLESEAQPLLDCLGRVLAEPVAADRDQPPFDRSTRDGFAVRAADGAEWQPTRLCHRYSDDPARHG